MSYLDLVEDHDKNDNTMTLFEKVIVAGKRAKDLHNKGRMPMVVSENTSAYIALEELRDAQINVVYSEEEVVALPNTDDDDDDE